MNINKRESYLTVAPTDGDKWSSLGLRFLIRAGMDFIIEPRTVLINGVETVVYPIDGVIQEKTYRQQLASYSSTRMIHSLLETIEFVDNSEFLSRHNIVLDEEFIYWDTSNETGKFVVVPVEAADSADEQLRLETWMRNCLSFIMSQQDVADTGSIRELLGKEMIPINDFETIISSLKRTDNAAPKEQQETASAVQVAPEKELTLRYTGDYGRFVLCINKRNYVIGKSDDSDGVVSFNQAVSRQHCAITFSRGSYFVEDLNSSNGTYLNGTRLMQGQKYVVMEGAVLQIADMSFSCSIQ